MPDLEFSGIIGNNQIESCSLTNSHSTPHPNQDRVSYACGNLGNLRDTETFAKTTIKDLNDQDGHANLENSGSTICAIVYDNIDEKVTIANLGDSKAYAILTSKSNPAKKILVSLSEDFRAETPRFEEKIRKKGGEVKFFNYAYRINGDGPAMAGCFGDKMCKPLLKDPDVFSFSTKAIATTIKNKEGGEEDFEVTSLFVASDGFSDLETSFLPLQQDDKSSPLHNQGIFHSLYKFSIALSRQEVGTKDGKKKYQIIQSTKLEKAERPQYSRPEDIAESGKRTAKGIAAQNEYISELKKSEDFNEDVLTSAKHLVTLAQKLGSRDDITIAQIDLRKKPEKIDEKNRHTFLVAADGHGEYGHDAAEMVVQNFQAKFAKRTFEVNNPSQPSSRPAGADASAAAGINNLQISPSAS